MLEDAPIDPGLSKSLYGGVPCQRGRAMLITMIVGPRQHFCLPGAFFGLLGGAKRLGFSMHGSMLGVLLNSNWGSGD